MFLMPTKYTQFIDTMVAPVARSLARHPRANRELGEFVNYSEESRHAYYLKTIHRMQSADFQRAGDWLDRASILASLVIYYYGMALMRDTQNSDLTAAAQPEEILNDLRELYGFESLPPR